MKVWIAAFNFVVYNNPIFNTIRKIQPSEILVEAPAPLAFCFILLPYEHRRGD